jgi:hypothetical protein
MCMAAFYPLQCLGEMMVERDLPLIVPQPREQVSRYTII